MDVEKVQMMTKLALFEKKEEHDALERVKYERRDYVRLSLLKDLICITLGYLLILLMIALDQVEYLLKNALHLNWSDYTFVFGGMYLVLCIVYLFFRRIVLVRSYHKSKKQVKEYDRELHLLRRKIRKQNSRIERKSQHELDNRIDGE